MTALFFLTLITSASSVHDVRTNDLPLARKHLGLPFWRQIGCLTLLFINPQCLTPLLCLRLMSLSLEIHPTQGDLHMYGELDAGYVL